MSKLLKVCAIGIIGQANNPLFLKVYDKDEEEESKFHYISYTSLDAVEERIQSRKNLSSSSDMYLGFLFSSEIYKIYGFITNTKSKFILILDESEVKEQDLRNFFLKLQILYINQLSNPFYSQEEKISSKNFELKLLDLITKFESGNSKHMSSTELEPKEELKE